MKLSSAPVQFARTTINRIAGDEIHVVRVLSGTARGSRLALDLTREKAYWLGRYERPVQQFMRANVGPSDVFFDIGAHIGFFSVCAGCLGARVVAVEPVPASAARVRRNAELNGFDIHVVEGAAWDETGAVALIPGDSAEEFRVGAGNGVPSVTLDELAVRCATPSVIKIDVEGAEGRVLAGASRLLAEIAPLIVCELHGLEQRARVLELLQGYRVTELGSPYRVVARPAQ